MTKSNTILLCCKTARSNADRPRVPVPDLKGERIACQIRDAFLDDVVAGTKKNDDGSYAIPHTAELLRRIKTSIGTMLSCLPETSEADSTSGLGSWFGRRSSTTPFRVRRSTQ